MLILRRKAGEAISIGDDVLVTIIEVQGNQVKVGIEAPSGISIYRDELLEKIKAENLKAAEISPDSFQSEFFQKITKNVQKRDIKSRDRGLRGIKDEDRN